MSEQIAETRADIVPTKNGTLEKRQVPLVVRTPSSDHWEDTDGTNHLHIDMPGVAEGDLSLTIEGRTLTVEGLKKKLSTRVGATIKYERRFRLSDELDAGQIDAELSLGVLRVRIPRRPEAKRKTITIHVPSD